MRHSAKIGTLSIPSADDASGVLPVERTRFFKELEIHPPDTIDSGVNVQVREEGDTDWDDWAPEGTVISLTAGQVRRFPAPNELEMRLNATGDELADRDYEVYGIEELR